MYSTVKTLSDYLCNLISQSDLVSCVYVNILPV